MYLLSPCCCGQELGLVWLGPLLQGLSQSAVKLRLRLQSAQGLPGEILCFQAHVVIGKTELLEACWTKVFRSFLAVG
jgi:hypothetical protein